MNKYLIQANVNDEIPYYTFMLEADTVEFALKKAEKIVRGDYSDKYNLDGYDVEITAKEITSLDQIFSEMDLTWAFKNFKDIKNQTY